MRLQTTQVYIPPGVIDLGLGNPDPALLPLSLLQRSAELYFKQNNPSYLQYGAEAGDGHFRLALSRFISRAYGFAVNIDNLFITAGASGALDLLCTLYTQPGDVIFVEEPSYFLALRIFADHGLRLVSIQTDEAGLVIEDLEQKLKRFRPRLLYIIPTYQNPSGQTLSATRREQLAAISREHDLMIVADEVYHFLNYDGKPPRPLAGYTQNSKIVSIGSFSKILAPGLRLGWIQANEEIVHHLSLCGLLDSGGGMNPFISALVLGLLKNDELEAHIARLKAVYAERIPAVEAALNRYLPNAVYTRPQGGYFFWIRLPGVDTRSLQERARAFKVDIRPGARFSGQGGMGEYFRLCFAYYPADKLKRGIHRLSKCLQNSRVLNGA